LRPRNAPGNAQIFLICGGMGDFPPKSPIPPRF
jgi:hypothetical protein